MVAWTSVIMVEVGRSSQVLGMVGRQKMNRIRQQIMCGRQEKQVTISGLSNKKDQTGRLEGEHE